MKTVDQDTLEQLASRVAGGLGYDVVDLEWKHEAGRWVLRVYIDFAEATLTSASGMQSTASTDSSDDSSDPGPDPRLVSLNNCSHLSRVLSAELDVSELISVPFTLEVSSPGVNRPLKRESDFRRFAGQKAKIRTRQEIGRAHV